MSDRTLELRNFETRLADSRAGIDKMYEVERALESLGNGVARAREKLRQAAAAPRRLASTSGPAPARNLTQTRRRSA